MSKILMIYNIKGNDSDRITLNRKLFCYKVQSHKGKYKRTSKGILTKYEKPTRSVVVFDKKFFNNIKKVMVESNAEYKFYEISNQLS